MVDQLIPGRAYTEPWDNDRPRVEMEAVFREHVRLADAKAYESVARRTGEFSDFIQSKKEGSKPFSEDLVSWYGKWRAVKPYLPFTKSEGHTEYVAEKFSHHIFTTEELAAAVRRAIEGSIKDLESAENELAVALRQEILGRALKPDEVPIAAEEFRKAIATMIASSQWDAAKTAGSLVASELAAQIATQVLIRLGVSTAILATGAANSWWSFGVAALVGLIVDQIWNWVDDPAGDIERQMNDALDKLSLEASKAINDEMRNVITQRSELWNKRVTEILP